MTQATTAEGKPSRYLNLGWRLMVIWGLGIGLFGVLMSLLNHVVSPQILYYTSADAQYTGVTWAQLQLLYPKLGLWLVLFFDTTTSQLLFYGILTAFVAATAYRQGERWAWISLLLAFLITFAHLIPTFFFLNSGILANSGISIGIAGILIMLAFLVAGLLLPGTELLKKPIAISSARPKGSRRLSFSWIVLLVVAGALNIFFAIIVPLLDHLSYPAQPGTYGNSDALFSGASWQQIMTLSPALGLWIVLQMDNMCAAMMGGGILASVVSVKGFRYSQRWAWFALLSAMVLFLTPFYLILIPFYQNGIYTSASAISFGIPPDPGFFLALGLTAIPVLALVLPITHFRLRHS